MSTRTRLLLHGLAIVGLLAATVYVHHTINAITQTFVEVREEQARFFAKLVQDNWDGISTVTNEKKEILVQNLDPGIAGADLRTMRDLMLILFYALMATMVVQTVISAVKVWKVRSA